MVDEFVHQFQSFCQFRGKVKSRTLEEKQLIKAHPQVWDIASVIRILSLLSEKVDGVRISQMHKHESVEEGKFSLLHFLGFFSLICLAHVHVLIGDYNTALSIVDSLDLRKGGVYQKNLSVHLTLCYLVGFVFLFLDFSLFLFSFSFFRSLSFFFFLFSIYRFSLSTGSVN